MKRRDFLQYGTLATGSLFLSLGASQWLFKAQAATSSPQRLIVILLRGAVDGLNILVPYADPTYYEVRPQIAIAAPNNANGALALDDRFGLHPSLSSLLPLWQNKSLAFIPASGSPDPTRSHFEAQDYLESGTPGQKKTATGWLNRLLAEFDDRNPVQALNVGNTTPRILIGPHAIASLAPGNAANRSLPIDQPKISNAFDRLYQGQASIDRIYREARTARQILLANLNKEMTAASQGAPLPNGFVGDAQRIAKIMTQDPNVQIAFIDLGGWDTHVDQGSSQGSLANRLQPLGEGVAALVQGLGNLYKNTVIVVMSEFGRTVRENGSGGTDHGHGNVMWLMGGSLKGGQIYGSWRGLAMSELYEERDVPVLTDFRDPLSTILAGHFQLNSAQLKRVFPGYGIQQHLPFL